MHEDDSNEYSDGVIDSLKREITELESQYPLLLHPQSQSQVVAGGVKQGFEKTTHQVRQWSLNDIFTKEELMHFLQEVDKWNYDKRKEVRVIAEDKIDGLKIILTYQDGTLICAATRGNGVVGENVTNNIKFVADIPKKLNKQESIIVEGEIFITTKEFNRINKERSSNNQSIYANPRNLAAGTIRQLDSSIVAKRELQFFAYDMTGDNLDITSQQQEVDYLKNLGFITNPHCILCKTAQDILLFWQDRIKQQSKLKYGIDGVVIKVDDLTLQKKMGHTGKAPRFACAFKFPSPEVTTQIIDINFQVGRTGIVTPVALLTPILISGSTVSRATLHNQDFIDNLDICIGDTVIIHKAGDIIPEVKKVITELRPANTKKFTWPTTISECGGDGSIYRPEGKSAWYCKHVDSTAIQVRKFAHFVGKNAFDIEGMGNKTIKQFIEAGLLHQYADIFTLQAGDIIGLDGWQQTSITNLLTAIHTKRKIKFTKLLIALSIPGLGEEMSFLLARRFKTIDKIITSTVEQLTEIERIDRILSGNIHIWMQKNQHQLSQLMQHLTIIQETPSMKNHKFNNKRIVITGSFDKWGRRQIKEKLRSLGAEIGSTVSKNTDYLVCGQKPGSKLLQAKACNTDLITGEELEALMYE